MPFKCLIYYFNTQDVQESEKATTSSKEPLCKQKIHRKVLDKGVPEDAMPGLKNVKVGVFLFLMKVANVCCTLKLISGSSSFVSSFRHAQQTWRKAAINFQIRTRPTVAWNEGEDREIGHDVNKRNCF